MGNVAWKLFPTWVMGGCGAIVVHEAGANVEFDWTEKVPSATGHERISFPAEVVAVISGAVTVEAAAGLLITV